MKNLYHKLKPHGSSLAFVAGFIWDNVMLSRIDHAFANLMLGTYLVLSALCIIVLNMHEARRARGFNPRQYADWLPLILQFCFGSLFSAYIIFYTASASLAVNWPFLIFLVFLVISNEIFRARYVSTVFQFCIFFIVLFSYSIFSLPILLGKMGAEIFILSGLCSLGILAVFGFVIKFVAREVFMRSRLPIIASIAVIYAFFNLAYFSNLIPPIPLSLKEIGVYHSVERTNDRTYTLAFEPGWFYPFFKDTSDIYSRVGNEPVYVWSSIFAPTKLSVPIFHTWSYFDETDKIWVMTDRLEFPIVGGREGGYRGYSRKAGVFPARWRVAVETARKERVGLVEFKIVNATKPPANLVREAR